MIGRPFERQGADRPQRDAAGGAAVADLHDPRPDPGGE
jgi:hypothetical protein